MIVLLMTAFAGDRVLQYTLDGPGEVAVEETWTLPVDPHTYEVVVGGLPFVVTVRTENRHDTVVVVTSVDHLKGKKGKPERVSEAKLILYESYPGEVTHKTPVPKGYTGEPVDELAWTTGAVWAEEAGDAPPDAVEESASEPLDKIPEEAAEEPAEEPAGEQAPE